MRINRKISLPYRTLFLPNAVIFIGASQCVDRYALLEKVGICIGWAARAMSSKVPVF